MIQVRCDYCGEEIDRARGDVQCITVHAEGDKGGPKRRRWRDGYVAHYHGEPCYHAVFDAIQEIHEPDDGLEGIPTATAAQLAARPSLDHADDSPLDLQTLFEERDNPGGASFPLYRLSSDLRGSGLTLGGIYPGDYVREGIRTVGDLKRAIDDGTILNIAGVGPKTAAKVEAGLLRYLSTLGVSA